MKALRILGCMAVVTIPLMAADLAFAQNRNNNGGNGGNGGNNNNNPPRGAPAPLMGVGLPMAGGVLLALLLVRRFRQKE